MAVYTYLSIITLNVNGLNAPIKRQSDKLDKKAKTFNLLSTRNSQLRAKGTYRLKVRGWEKIFHDNGQDWKAGIAIIISDKIDLKMKAIKKDIE